MGKATNSIARKGSRGKFPLAEFRGGASGGVWGNAPTVSRATSMPNALNKGAGSEASLPVTLRVLRRAPKLLYPQPAYCRARWARPTSMGEGFLSLLVFFIAGISPLRRRKGGFPIAPLTPSAPPRLGLSATRFVRSKRFLYQRAFCLIIKPRQPLDNCPHLLPGLCYAVEKCTYACSNCELYSSA